MGSFPIPFLAEEKGEKTLFPIVSPASQSSPRRCQAARAVPPPLLPSSWLSNAEGVGDFSPPLPPITVTIVKSLDETDEIITF